MLEKSNSLVLYESACKAVAQARTIDEVKQILNKAEQARAYARQAKNKEMEKDAAEIRVRAERRLGEIIIELREQKLLNIKGGESNKGQQKRGKHNALIPLICDRLDRNESIGKISRELQIDRGTVRRARRLKGLGITTIPTLTELGIDRDMARTAQHLAKMTPRSFEKGLAEWRDDTRASVKVPLQEIRKPEQLIKHARRREINENDLFAKFQSAFGGSIADFYVGSLNNKLRLLRIEVSVLETVKLYLGSGADPGLRIRDILSAQKLAEFFEQARRVNPPDTN